MTHMKSIRRGLAVLLVSAVAAFTLAACSPVIPEGAEALPVYATFYPIYALTDAVVRDVPGIELHCLVQPQDGCLRNYELSEWDSRLIASSKAVVMGGRGLESFEGTLFSLGESGPALAAALYNLELYNSSTSHGDGEGDSHLSGVNPHLYMSVEGATHMIESIAASMLEIDPDYAELYAGNVERATEQLDTLRSEMLEIAGDIGGKPVILMNEALIYTAQDFNLTVADWVDRESGTALYDEALDKCLERLKRTGADVILIERQAPQGFVEALTDAGFAVARIDVLSTGREGDGFDGYLKAQRVNATAIRAAFDAAEGHQNDQEDQP